MCVASKTSWILWSWDPKAEALSLARERQQERQQEHKATGGTQGNGGVSSPRRQLEHMATAVSLARERQRKHTGQKAMSLAHEWDSRDDATLSNLPTFHLFSRAKAVFYLVQFGDFVRDLDLRTRPRD